MGDCFTFLLGDAGSEYEEKPPQTKKFGPFQFDMRYLHSGPGLVKCAQVLFLWIAFFCTVVDTSSTPWQTQNGVFVFLTIALVLGALISSYILFTKMASTRAEECCGVSWRFVELLFYGVFGAILFLGSCLTASQTGGEGNLAAAIAFAFLAIPTFALSFITAWRSKKNDDDDEKKPEGLEENLPPGVNLYPESFIERNPYSFEDEDEFIKRGTGLMSSRASLKRSRSQLSLRNSMYDQEIDHLPERRRYSASDKDSAFSEGFFSPREGRNTLNMRRTSSFHNFDSQRYPATLFQQRGNPFGENRSSQRRNFNTQQRRMSGGYPQRLAANSLKNLGRNYNTMDRDDTFSEVDSTATGATQMPGWLRAALDDDDIVEKKKAGLPFQGRRNPSFTTEATHFSFHPNDQRAQQFRSQTGNRMSGRLMSTMSNQTYDTFADPRAKTLQFHPSVNRRMPQQTFGNQDMGYSYS